MLDPRPHRPRRCDVRRTPAPAPGPRGTSGDRPCRRRSEGEPARPERGIGRPPRTPPNPGSPGARNPLPSRAGTDPERVRCVDPLRRAVEGLAEGATHPAPPARPGRSRGASPVGSRAVQRGDLAGRRPPGGRRSRDVPVARSPPEPCPLRGARAAERPDVRRRDLDPGPHRGAGGALPSLASEPRREARRRIATATKRRFLEALARFSYNIGFETMHATQPCVPRRPRVRPRARGASVRSSLRASPLPGFEGPPLTRRFSCYPS